MLSGILTATSLPSVLSSPLVFCHSFLVSDSKTWMCVRITWAFYKNKASLSQSPCDAYWHGDHLRMGLGHSQWLATAVGWLLKNTHQHSGVTMSVWFSYISPFTLVLLSSFPSLKRSVHHLRQRGIIPHGAARQKCHKLEIFNNGPGKQKGKVTASIIELGNHPVKLRWTANLIRTLRNRITILKTQLLFSVFIDELLDCLKERFLSVLLTALT